MEEQEVETVCPYCDGEGELAELETVYPGEPHQAWTGSRPCICQIKNQNEDD